MAPRARILCRDAEWLVKCALKELLKDKAADNILTLTVCEPAMGSAAFLNEVIDLVGPLLRHCQVHRVMA